MLSIKELATQLDPRATVLFLGAGSSIPSGAPSGGRLALELVNALSPGDDLGTDLLEVASILDGRYGRVALVRAVRQILQPLTPTGGLLALPLYPWNAIYTTNFDQLVEQAYRQAAKHVIAIRSNFEYGRSEAEEGTPLYKIHGCISQDIADGHKAGMTLTERDYEDYASFRQVLFRSLGLAMTAKDTLIIGYSLRDPHLKAALDEAARLHAEQETPGRLIVLAFDADPDRAGLLERRGYQVCAGDLDGLMAALADTSQPAATEIAEEPGATLPPRLTPSTVDASHAKMLTSNVTKLFNGSPATYADVVAGFTIERDSEAAIVDRLLRAEYRFVTITGVAGVGKTTLARRVVLSLEHNGVLAWEHRPEFPFYRREWIALEAKLREAGKRGVLLLDECPAYLRQVNQLADQLAQLEDSALSLVLTAGTAQWRPRSKTPALYNSGFEVKLSVLSTSEVESLVNLVDQRTPIRSLVETSFARMSRRDQIDQLRRRCSADMYVCLKNIFATEALDTILLREFADLSEELQDIYRHVAALEATGAQVHRQLIVRLLGIDAGTIKALLTLSEGIVDEFDIKPADGIFGWSTRHRRIAQTIARYKFADEDDRAVFFSRVISAANPALWLELRLLRELCDREFGIGSFADDSLQEEMLRKLVLVAPGERIPRHRLIGLLLRRGDPEGTDIEIRVAEENVGIDPPISRYKVRSTILRATITEGILDEDRRAMLMEAERLAIAGIKRFPGDKYAYMAYVEVGESIAERFGEKSVLEEAYISARSAYEGLLDPDFGAYLNDVYAELRRY